MRNVAPSLKVIGPCLLLAGAMQFAVCRTSVDGYSNARLGLLSCMWAIGSLTLAWFEQRPLLVYLGSVALAAPAISFSMLGHGLLEMGGLLHALAAGAWSSPFYLLFRHLRNLNHRATL